MKSSVIRSLMMFVAGAGCATAVAGFYPVEPIGPEQFLERVTKVLVEVEALGGYVGVAQDGRVGIYTQVGACVYPPPPPKMPANAVDSRSLNNGVKALVEINQNFLFEEGGQPVYVLDKCKPYDGKRW